MSLREVSQAQAVVIAPILNIIRGVEEVAVAADAGAQSADLAAAAAVIVAIIKNKSFAR